MDSSFISDFTGVRAREISANISQWSNGALIAIQEQAPEVWKRIQVDESRWKELLQTRFPDEAVDHVGQKEFCRTVKKHLNQDLFAHINAVKVDNVLGTDPVMDPEHPGSTHRGLISTLGSVYATFSISQLAAMDVPVGLEYEHREAMGQAVCERLLNHENEIDVSGTSFKDRPAAFHGLVDGLQLYAREAKGSPEIKLDLSDCSLDSNMLYSLIQALEGQTVSALNLANNHLDAMAIGVLGSLTERNPLVTLTLSGNANLPASEAQVLGPGVIA